MSPVGTQLGASWGCDAAEGNYPALYRTSMGGTLIVGALV